MYGRKLEIRVSAKGVFDTVLDSQKDLFQGFMKFEDPGNL